VTVFSKMKYYEKIPIGLILIGLIVELLTRFHGALDICVFGLILSIMYFPLGFYTLGTSNANNSYITSIILGLIYSIGVITIVFGTFKISSYKYPIIIELGILLIVAAFIFFRSKVGKYDTLYLDSQFTRIVLLAVMNLIVLLK